MRAAAFLIARPGPIAAALLAAVVAGLLAFTLQAEPLSGEALEQRVLEVSEQLRCPTCQAISVRDSEAAFSRQIRDKVRELLQAGKTEEEIMAFFVASYGEWILRAPKKEGVGLLLWVLPGLAIVGAGLLLGLRVYRNSQRTAEAPPAAPEALSEADRARIERDLRRFDEEG